MQKSAFPILLLFFLLSVGVVLFSQKQQEFRTRASADTTLALLPATTLTNPIVKRVGDTIAFDVILTPGTNQVSTVKVHVSYDSSVFEVSEKNGFAVNKKAFPFAVEGPLINDNDGSVIATFFVGADPKQSISVPTKVGTVTLKAVRETYNLTSSKIFFEETSRAYSVSSQDYAYENVIATTTPAYVIIRPRDAASLSITPRISESSNLSYPVVFPTEAITPSVSPTPSPSPVPTQPPTDVKLSVKVTFPGIGKGKLANSRPKRTTRYAKLLLVNPTTFVSTLHDISLQYNENDGFFEGKLSIPNFVSGIYTIQIKADGYMQTELAKNKNLTVGSDQTLPLIPLVGGDVNNSGTVNIVDYNLILACSAGSIDPKKCSMQAEELADLDDNGLVDENDLFIFIKQNE